MPPGNTGEGGKTHETIPKPLLKTACYRKKEPNRSSMTPTTHGHSMEVRRWLKFWQFGVLRLVFNGCLTASSTPFSEFCRIWRTILPHYPPWRPSFCTNRRHFLTVWYAKLAEMSILAYFLYENSGCYFQMVRRLLDFRRKGVL